MDTGLYRFTPQQITLPQDHLVALLTSPPGEPEIPPVAPVIGIISQNFLDSGRVY